MEQIIAGNASPTVNPGVFAPGKPAVQPTLADLNKRFDIRMYTRINTAKDFLAWTELTQILCNAHGWGNLRTNVSKRYLQHCPHKKLVEHFCSVTGNRPPRQERGPSPLRSGRDKFPKKTRAQIEANRAKSRAQRVGPAKGAAGQKPPKHGQKKDKK